MSAASSLSVARPATLFDAEKMIEQLQQRLQISELRVLVLEERLRLRRIEKYGAGSEKLSNLQLEILEQEPGVSQAELQAESDRPTIAGDAIDVAGINGIVARILDVRRCRRSCPG